MDVLRRVFCTEEGLTQKGQSFFDFALIPLIQRGVYFRPAVMMAIW